VQELSATAASEAGPALGLSSDGVRPPGAFKITSLQGPLDSPDKQRNASASPQKQAIPVHAVSTTQAAISAQPAVRWQASASVGHSSHKQPAQASSAHAWQRASKSRVGSSQATTAPPRPPVEAGCARPPVVAWCSPAAARPPLAKGAPPVVVPPVVVPPVVVPPVVVPPVVVPPVVVTPLVAFPPVVSEGSASSAESRAGSLLEQATPRSATTQEDRIGFRPAFNSAVPERTRRTRGTSPCLGNLRGLGRALARRSRHGVERGSCSLRGPPSSRGRR
jgi:hypothetical protein